MIRKGHAAVVEMDYSARFKSLVGAGLYQVASIDWRWSRPLQLEA